jgi:thioredoxin 1
VWSLPDGCSRARRDRLQRPDLRIVKLNIDDNQQTAAAFQVLSIPTMILFKGGQAIKTVIGALPKKRLEAELEPALAAA